MPIGVLGRRPLGWRLAAGALLLSLSACQDAPATAPGCQLREVASLPIDSRGNQLFVPLTVNGVRLSMLLDTGSFVTLLTESAAIRLSLPVIPGRHTRLADVGGAVVLDVVASQEVFAGGLALGALPFAVIPDTAPLSHSPGIDGVLGASFLSAFDVDLDLPAAKMRLYQPRVCALNAPPWRAPSTRIPARRADYGHLVIPVAVAGQPMNAVLDTGAEHTAIEQAASLRAGVPAASLAADPGMRALAIGQGRMKLHRFNSITVGRENFPDVVLAVQLSPPNAPPRHLLADVAPRAPLAVPVILGMDYIAAHRLWLSYATETIFVLDRSPQ